jgi:hypothetical protein
MKRQLLLAVSGLLFASQFIFADEIRLTSTKTESISLSVVTSAATTVSVDWGNGTPVTTDITQTDINGTPTALTGVPVGEIIVKGEGITVFDCSLSGVTALDVTKATNLIKLSFNNNQLTTINLSNNTALYSLHAELNPGLTSLNLSANTALELLYCSDNNMTSLDVSKNIKLTTLNFNNNKLTTIDLTKNTALKSLYAISNLFESVDVSKNTAATYISFNTNKLTSIDVTGLTALKSLFLLNNNIVEIKGANEVAKSGTLNCTGNKLNLATLPQPEALKSTYNYAPQQAYSLPASITVGETLDLSSQTNVKGVLAVAAATTYKWTTKSGTVLVKGTDYDETNGVFKFLKAQSENVICSMTTTAFPKFTTTTPFSTTEMAVVVSTGVKNTDNQNGVKIYAADRRISVEGITENQDVRIFNLQGAVVYQSKGQSAILVDVNAGMYIVYAGSQVQKVVVK